MAGQMIEVRIGPNGEVEVEAHGFKGKGCKAATEFIEKAIGGKQTDVKKKAEWWLQNSEAVRRERKLGYNPGKICG